jgi:hypothetical protein
MRVLLVFFWNTLWAQINKEVVITKVQIYVKNPSSTGTGDTRKNRPLR